MNAILSRVLWVDCVGAAVAGVAMLALSGWLNRLYAWPPGFVVGVALVNLLYGTYSFSLAVRRNKPRRLVMFLVIANASWAAICLLAAVWLVNTASVFGVAHFVLEGLYVGGLARVERRLL